MAVVLVATPSGCRVFAEGGGCEVELAGLHVSALGRQPGGSCLAVVAEGPGGQAEQQIWRRDGSGRWSQVAAVDVWLQSITGVGEIIFGGGMEEAIVVRIAADGTPERLPGFDSVPGRSEWFAGGPPLGVRSLAATADGGAILAAVHVGGIPRSSDGGESWTPTVPIIFDVHEVCAHPSLPNMVAAAAAVGLCLSHDGGLGWTVVAEDLEMTNSLALAMLQDEVLFSIQDGPFAKRSQIRRFRFDDNRAEQVRDGLPEWLDGKVDTAHIAAGAERAAVIDGGGNLWLSSAGSRGWERVATDVPYCSGVLIL